MYHRACIDPWLLKHRSCPLCKQNILIACGLSLAEEDAASCSATTSEANSGLSLSATSASPSTSSIPASLEGLFCPPLVLFSCRHPRRRRRRHYHHHFYRNFQHVRRPSSSLDEVSAPFGGRRVLGSASENSSSSITARSLPSDLLFHTAAISPSVPEKSTTFPAEEPDGEDERVSVGRTIGRRGRRNLMTCCSCCAGGGIGRAKGTPDGRLPSPQLTSSTCGTTLPSALVFPPPVAHPPAMLLYHLPHSMPLAPGAMATKAALPSYEQATAAMPQATFVTLPASPLACPHQSLVGWSPNFPSEPGQQEVADLLDSSKRSYSVAKTSLVYAVLSASGARVSVNNGLPPASVLCTSSNKLPIFIDVNSPKVTEAFEGQRQCLLSSSSPPLVQTRESPPPAYFLSTVASTRKSVGTSLHPLRRVARFLATHLLSSPLTKQQQLRHRYYTSFFGGLKHHQQHRESKHRLKPRPRRLHKTSPLATATGTAATSVIRRHHRHRGYHRVGVLGKTLELNHEGVIMSSRLGTPTIGAELSPVPSSHPPPLSGSVTSHRCASNSVSESYSGGIHRASLRHTRVHSVRVTVEPQAQYHTERDAASCEALHNAHLHSIGSKNSLPRTNSLPTPLKSVSADVDVTVTVAAVAASLWRCRSFSSAPTICSPISRLTDTISSSSPSLSLPPV
ncbi:unnamed protein product [Hydatigera taeniaeformis]|uniref:RING-type domain-containing protein n=1 Tax=Hydatigena taeniaeformis TaxID=6205 RepID=A0A0R3X7Y1_HYDTA|nr:unnamed protein product [Hydatigera taeniaeformis]